MLWKVNGAARRKVLAACHGTNLRSWIFPFTGQPGKLAVSKTFAIFTSDRNRHLPAFRRLPRLSAPLLPTSHTCTVASNLVTWYLVLSVLCCLNQCDTMSLIDPSLLENLSEEQREEALAAAAAAKRAEERAEQRALERALAAKAAERQREAAATAASQTTKPQRQVVFVSKDKRNGGNQQPLGEKSKSPQSKLTAQPQQLPPSSSTWSDSQWAAVKQSYLGKSVTESEEVEPEQRHKQRSKKKITFKFQWDDTEDTSHLEDGDPLYVGIKAAPKRKRQRLDELPKSMTPTIESALSKPIDKMTARDWHIFRETHNIVIKGGNKLAVPPPMRSFREPPSPSIPPLHPAILEAIEVTLKYKEPSPIQRQAIPIGLQRRDLIGVAETGSGKTAAFGIPLCHYLLNLPPTVLNQVADEGPLAIVMAPTRELALQIDAEFHKLLSRQTTVQSCAIVGGQVIQQQAQRLREGVHVVVGTPGRINDCLEMAYLVLNQCCYIVLDEGRSLVFASYLFNSLI